MNDTLKRHFMNPRNMGTIKKATHSGRCKSGFCGDTVEVTATVDPQSETITAVKYKVFGCYAVIAAASIISEWCLSKTLSEVQELGYDLVSYLIGGEIEPGKESCIQTAIDAFKNLSAVSH